MKPVGYTSILLTPFILLLHFCASAQGVVFTANASAQKIGLDDQLELSFTIHNVTDLVSMGAGQLKGFKLIAGPFQNSSSSTSIINGRASQSMSVSFTYVLQPKQTGNLTIAPGVAKDAAGNTYYSNQLSVVVVKGTVGGGFGAVQSSVPSARQQLQRNNHNTSADLSKELILKAVAEKSSAHTGEQVTIKWKLYRRVSLLNATVKMPLLNGVYSQSFDSASPERQAIEMINGRKYVVDVIKKIAVFPQQAGDLVIDPAVIEGYVPVQSSENNPFNDPFFQQTMGSMGLPDPFGENVPVIVKSEPLTLHIVPLSNAGQPQNYTGAVGSFTLKSSLDKSDPTTDDIITLTLLIEGRGNFKLFTAPKLTLPKGLSSYDPRISDSITGKGDAITGAKTIAYSISPQAAGDYTIPAQSFTFFNPESGSYETATTGLHTIHVRPGRKSERNIKSPTLTQIHDIDQRLTGQDNSPTPANNFSGCLLGRPRLSPIGFRRPFAISPAQGKSCA